MSQGLLRLAFLALTLIQIGLTYGLNTFTLLSAVLGVAATVAGLLAWQRFALAREFGMAFCVAGLLYQLLDLAYIVQMGWAAREPLTNWIVLLGFAGIDVAALIVFWTSPYYRARAQLQR